jgi:bacteriocin-like protein
MKNNNLKLVELNTKELKQIEGGIFFMIPLLIGIAIGWAFYEVV